MKSNIRSLLTTIILIIAALSVLATPPLFFDVPLPRAYFARALAYCILTPIIAYVCNRFKSKGNPERKSIGLSATLSIIFSQFICIGQSIFLTSSLRLCFYTPLSILYWIIATIVCAYIIYPIIDFIIQWLNTNINSANQNSLNIKKLLYVAAGIRGLLLIVFFPGIFDFDASFGLRTMIQQNEVISNHHPYFVQLVHSLFYKLGNLIGMPSIGMALISIVLITFSCFTIYYVITVLRLLKTNDKAISITGYILALFPLYPLLSIYITKDGFFAYSFLLYLTAIIKLYASKGRCITRTSFLMVLILSGLLMCMTRHQGIYIIGISTIGYTFLYRKYLIRTLTSGIIPIIVMLFFNNTVLPTLDVEETNKKESYNMFFQQTALYVRDYPSDITSAELQAIESILPIDSIRNAYTSNITDNVKSLYKYTEGDNLKFQSDGLLHFRHVNHSGETEDLASYREAWKSMFFRHPAVYCRAWLNVENGYFFNIGNPIFTFDSNWDTPPASNENYSFYHTKRPLEVCSEVAGYLSNLPFTDLFASLPYYIWATILLIMILIWRGDFTGIVVFMPIILSICVLCICPVASGRYEYPIIIGLPLMILYTKTQHNNAKTLR